MVDIFKPVGRLLENIVGLLAKHIFVLMVGSLTLGVIGGCIFLSKKELFEFNWKYPFDFHFALPSVDFF